METEVLRNAVAGVDVHKEKLVIATIVEMEDKTITRSTWESLTFTEDLEQAGKKLLDLGIKNVAMESTGIYWKPVFHVWSKMGIIITLANASHLKNVPGRKTDQKDSEWIADLHRYGLIKGSYLPEETFQELRALTRHRKNLTEEVARIKNRVQKILEDGNIKLSSVLSNVFGVAGILVVKALAEGEKDPDKLVDLIKTNVKAERKVLKKALTHTLRQYQVFLLQELLRQYMYHEALIQTVNDEIDKKMQPFTEEIKELDRIPGIDLVSAQDIVAEATTDMSNFKDAKTFAAWAGVAPGNNESGGKKKDRKPDTEILD